MAASSGIFSTSADDDNEDLDLGSDHWNNFDEIVSTRTEKFANTHMVCISSEGLQNWINGSKRWSARSKISEVWT